MQASEDPPDFIEPALQRLAQGLSLQDFCAWFGDAYSPMLLPGAEARVADAADAPAEARRAAIVLAREIWRVTPDPAHGWNTRSLPQPGRNDPCFCGSGRKYKQCCQALASDMPAIDLEPAGMGGLLFVQGPAAWRTVQALRAMPPGTLAAAAHAWGGTHGAAALVELLEPVFLAPAKLGAGHELACDLLADAMQEEGLDARREQLARTLVAHGGHRRLRSVGHSRLAVMLSDRGDPAGAWKELLAGQREDPDNAELLHLELTLLLAQGCEGEARARAPLLAARARKLGYPELAQLLPELAERGIDAIMKDLADDDIDDDEEGWIALLRAPLPLLQPERFARLHAVTDTGGQLEFEVTPELKRPLATWQRRFGAAPGMLTELDGDVDALLDEAGPAREWLLAHPDCAASVPVLDDLLMAARATTELAVAPEVTQAAEELAFAVAGMVVAASQHWPQAPLPWIVGGNRPLLRIVSQAIALALQAGEDELALEWMRWMLARNPIDNHGWREPLRIALLRQGDPRAALALLDAYPDDLPPSGHDRALALYLLHQREQAEHVLRHAHAQYPAFIAALLPAALDRPAGAWDDTGVVGGAEAAWAWRSQVRDLWSDCGALEWARGVGLPLEPAKRAKRARAKPAGKAKAPSVALLPPAADPLPVLRQQFGGRLPWLLGWLAGAAWAPAAVDPARWAIEALQRANCGPEDAAAEAMVAAVMEQYNLFNGLRLVAKPRAAVPLPAHAFGAGDDAAWAGFAAGFVQFAETSGAGGWRGVAATGHWAPLRQLAAHAEAAPGSWRALDDRERPLLAVADGGAPALDLLRHALQPLWERALDAR